MTTRAGHRLGIAALAAVPLAVLGVFFVLPVTGMVSRGFFPDGSFDPGGVLDVLGRPRVHRVLWFTLWSAGVARVSRTSGSSLRTWSRLASSGTTPP